MAAVDFKAGRRLAYRRAADPEDGRRIFIERSDEAADALTAYVQSAYQAGLRIVCAGPRVRRVFQVTDLDKVFPLYDSLPAAPARAARRRRDVPRRPDR